MTQMLVCMYVHLSDKHFVDKAVGRRPATISAPGTGVSLNQASEAFSFMLIVGEMGVKVMGCALSLFICTYIV